MSGGVLVRMVFVQVVFVRGGFCPYTTSGNMYSYLETGEFHCRNAGVSCVEAICTKRRCVILTNFTHLVS